MDYTDLVDLKSELDRAKPDNPLDFFVEVPVDTDDTVAMVQAVYELSVQGISQPLQLARYLRVSLARALALKMQVDEMFAEAMMITDPAVHRGRLAAAASGVQAEAMRVYHNAGSEQAKLQALKVALAAQKAQSDVLRLTGQTNKVVIDQSDRRTVVNNNDNRRAEIPDDVMQDLVDRMVKSESDALKVKRNR
jgi:hypothetical protein